MHKINLRKLVRRKQVPYLIAAGLLAIVCFAYLGRSLIRESVVPNTVELFMKNSLNKTTNQENDKLQAIYPFGHINYIHKDYTDCSRGTADNFHTEIFCETYLFRGQVSIKNISLAEFKSKIKPLEKSLDQDGWRIWDGDYDTIVEDYGDKWGWWYSAQYEKYVGNKHCDLTLERDNDPQYLDAYLGCGRSVTIF